MALDLLHGTANMANMAEVEQICEGGFGEEAHIDVQLRREYPGIGGVIYTYQALAVALRAEYHHTPLSGHKMFCKHAAIKKLEDYFFKKGTYRYAHVTRPLGSTDDAYIYEWAFGTDSFPWEYTEPDENLRYNSFQNQWEYAQPDDTLQYNSFDNYWQYTGPDSELDYNPFENQWEWTEPD